MSDTQLDIVWGAKAIGEVINRSGRQTHYLLEQGLIKSARKVGSTWTATRTGLLEELGAGRSHQAKSSADAA